MWSSWITLFSRRCVDKVDYSKHLLLHVEIFQIIFFLLKESVACIMPASVLNVHLTVIGHFDLLCENVENVNRMLDSPDFWNWVSVYWQVIRDCSLKNSVVDTSDASKVFAKLSSLLKRLLLHDIARSQSKVPSLRGNLVHCPNFLLFLIDLLIAYYLERSSLSESNNFAYNTLSNLYQLLYRLDEFVQLPVKLLISIVKAVNLIASHNTPDVRKLLIKSGLLSVRESIILQVSSSLLTFSPDEQLEVLLTLPFDSVVSNSTFRHSCAINFLALFHHIDPKLENVDDCKVAEITPAQMELMELAIIDLLRKQCSASESLLIHFAKIVQDAYVLHFVFPHIELQWDRSYGDCLPSFSASVNSPSQTASEETLEMLHNYSGQVSEFLSWYKRPSEEFRVKFIKDRILLELKPIFAAHLRELDRMETIRKDAISLRISMVQKRQNIVESLLNDLLGEKLAVARDQALKEFAIIQQVSAEARLKRAEDGENSWEKIRQMLVVSGYLPALPSSPTLASHSEVRHVRANSEPVQNITSAALSPVFPLISFGYYLLFTIQVSRIESKQ